MGRDLWNQSGYLEDFKGRLGEVIFSLFEQRQGESMIQQEIKTVNLFSYLGWVSRARAIIDALSYFGRSTAKEENFFRL